MTVPALLAVTDLLVQYHTASGPLRAVDGVSCSVGRGETVGLVGESGCGKSTLGNAILGLSPVAGGTVAFEGTTLSALSPRARKPFRSRIQMVFQDPSSALNPRLTAGRIIGEPLRVNHRGTRRQRQAHVRDLLAQVGLPADAAERYPHEFSGGQRQRIGIARALALQPALIVCDEPVSALDVSVQAQIVNLFADLQQKHGLSYLFISHDLAIVQHLADRVLVMYLGKIVEAASRETLWKAPLHPYTRALIAAAPVLKQSGEPQEGGLRLQGELPSPLNPPAGCRLHTRCPLVMPICRSQPPLLRPRGAGHLVACHLES